MRSCGIEVSALSFRYPGAASFALHDVTLSVPAGGFLGITGPSGAGKSTLAAAIAGIVPHCRPGEFYGTVRVGGLDTVDSPLAEVSRVVGSVFQDAESQLFFETVEDELLFGLENFGVDRASIEGRIGSTLELLGIADLRHRDVATLSGGQRQKVALASVLVCGPRVLVLDEPTSELDPRSSRDVYAMLSRAARATGATVVAIEQKIDLLASYADALAVMDRGRIVLSGDVGGVLGCADGLADAGVGCPQCTLLGERMRGAGVYAGPVCVTVDDAVRAVKEAVA